MNPSWRFAPEVEVRFLPIEGRLPQQRIDVVVDDPAQPYLVHLVVGRTDGQMIAEDVRIRRRPHGPTVTSEALGRIPLGSYVEAVISDPRTETHVAAKSDRTDRRRGRNGDDVLSAVAAAHRMAAADPKWRFRPIEAVAVWLHYSPGDASALVTAARSAGWLGATRRTPRSDQSPQARSRRLLGQRPSEPSANRESPRDSGLTVWDGSNPFYQGPR
jgi:hypothetical protein